MDMAKITSKGGILRCPDPLNMQSDCILSPSWTKEVATLQKKLLVSTISFFRSLPTVHDRISEGQTVDRLIKWETCILVQLSLHNRPVQSPQCCRCCVNPPVSLPPPFFIHLRQVSSLFFWSQIWMCWLSSLPFYTSPALQRKQKVAAWWSLQDHITRRCPLPEATKPDLCPMAAPWNSAHKSCKQNRWQSTKNVASLSPCYFFSSSFCSKWL